MAKETEEDTPQSDQANAAEEAARRMREELAKPIDEKEAQIALAEAEVQRCQLRAYINDLEAQIYECEGKIGSARSQLIALDCSDAVIRRRLCNGQGEAE